MFLPCKRRAAKDSNYFDVRMAKQCLKYQFSKVSSGRRFVVADFDRITYGETSHLVFNDTSLSPHFCGGEVCKPQGQKPVTNWTWVYDMRMLIGVGYPLVLRLFFQVDRQGLLSLLCKHKGQVRMMPLKDVLPTLIDS